MCGWLFVFACLPMRPCDELWTCPGCHPAFAPWQRGQAPAVQEELGIEDGWMGGSNELITHTKSTLSSRAQSFTRLSLCVSIWQRFYPLGPKSLLTPDKEGWQRDSSEYYSV